MNDEEFLELAARFVSHTASDEEIDRLTAVSADAHFARLLRIVQQTWNDAQHQNPAPESDTARGLNRLAEKLRVHEPAFRWGPNRRRFPARKSSGWQYGIAASLAFMMLLAGAQLLRVDFARRTQPSALIERRTSAGEKLVIALPDGSEMTLNAESVVKYPARFNAASRDVYLVGEAYFSVLHDDAHPFTVHTGPVTTTDLGTRFDIRAFTSDTTITVSLDQGSVNVACQKSGTAAASLTLSPSRQFVLNTMTGTIRTGSFDSRTASGWMDDLFVFDNQPLSIVMRTMGRRFGVGFELADSTFGARRITAEFHHESARTVAEILKKASGLSYTAVMDRNNLKKFVFKRSAR